MVSNDFRFFHFEHSRLHRPICGIVVRHQLKAERCKDSFLRFWETGVPPVRNNKSWFQRSIKHHEKRITLKIQFDSSEWRYIFARHTWITSHTLIVGETNAAAPIAQERSTNSAQIAAGVDNEAASSPLPTNTISRTE